MDALALNIRALTWLGQQLQQAREGQGISLEEIAQTTHIGLGLLRALEQGNSTSLPEPVYVQGFIRKYAQRVGLDFATLMAEAQAQGLEATPVAESKSWLRWQRHNSPSPTDFPNSVIPEPVLAESSPSAASPARTPLGYPLLGLLTLLIGSFAIFWVWQRSQPTAPPSTVTLTPPPLPPSAALKPEPEASAVNAPPTAKAVKTEVAVGSMPATIEANGPVWLEVWVDGKPQPGRMLKSGQQLNFQVRQSLRIYPGRPDMVTVRWGDRRVSPLGPIQNIRWYEFSTSPSPAQERAPSP
jgi:cytoskeleton protein RodZ